MENTTRKYEYINNRVGGLLGSNFSKFLLDNTEYNVIGIDDFSGGYRDFVDNRVKLYNIDLKEPINIEEKIDYIFHFTIFSQRDYHLLSETMLLKIMLKLQIK